jgi:hypothetical protein
VPFAYETQDTTGAGTRYHAGRDDVDSPESPHPARLRMLTLWRRARDLAAGQDAIVAARETYLPRHAAEDLEDYQIRLSHAELFNGFRRVVRAGVGLIHHTDPTLSDDAPEEFRQDWENIDGRGTAGPVFARRLTDDALITGVAGIVVDYAALPAQTTVDAATEDSLGLRPYWVAIGAEQLVSWRFASVNGRTVLVQLVLLEVVEVPVGRFGVGYQTQYRVFSRDVTEGVDTNGVKVTTVSSTVRWELWVKYDEKKPARLYRHGVMMGIDEIPFAPLVVGNDADGFECVPPLNDLAVVNLAHYRLQTDRNHLMHIGCVPIPVRTGYKDDLQSGRTTVGPNTLMDLPKDATFAYVEITGASFEPSEKDLAQKESRMGALGMAFLAPQTRAAETAEAKRIDATAQNADLSTVAQAVQDCLNNAAQLHAKFRKLTAVPGITVNREFERIVMDTGLVDALSRMEQAGQLTLDTLFAMLKRGHILPDDFDAETEQAKLLERAKEMLKLSQGTPGDNTGDPTDPAAGGGA